MQPDAGVRPVYVHRELLEDGESYVCLPNKRYIYIHIYIYVHRKLLYVRRELLEEAAGEEFSDDRKPLRVCAPQVLIGLFWRKNIGLVYGRCRALLTCLSSASVNRPPLEGDDAGLFWGGIGLYIRALLGGNLVSQRTNSKTRYVYSEGITGLFLRVMQGSFGISERRTCQCWGNHRSRLNSRIVGIIFRIL
jgi:hypothetical protein